VALCGVAHADDIVVLPPGTIAPVAPVGPSGRSLIEIGPSLSNASVGVEGELALAVSPTFRLGVMIGVNDMFTSFAAEEPGNVLTDAGIELRHVGTGTSHFDFGVAGGAAKDGYDTGGFGLLRFSYVREYERYGVSYSVEPLALFDFLGQWSSVAIGVMASVKLEIPL
jgi:hypothetical protein